MELTVGARLAYVHYLGRHPEYGDAILVSSKLYEQPTVLATEMFVGGYVTFYPATAAVAQGLVRLVGHLPAPSVPARFRRRGAIVDRRVASWVIEEEAGDIVKKKLSQADLLLPIASIWNHEYLVQRISQNWDPAADEESPPQQAE